MGGMMCYERSGEEKDETEKEEEVRYISTSNFISTSVFPILSDV